MLENIYMCIYRIFLFLPLFVCDIYKKFTVNYLHIKIPIEVPMFHFINRLHDCFKRSSCGSAKWTKGKNMGPLQTETGVLSGTLIPTLELDLAQKSGVVHRRWYSEE